MCPDEKILLICIGVRNVIIINKAGSSNLVDINLSLKVFKLAYLLPCGLVFDFNTDRIPPPP